MKSLARLGIAPLHTAMPIVGILILLLALASGGVVYAQGNTPPNLDVSINATLVNPPSLLAKEGETVSYEVKVDYVQNDCSTAQGAAIPCDPFSNVEVAITLPSQVTFVQNSAVPSAGFDSTTMTWTVASVSLSEPQHTLTFNATVDIGTAGTRDATAAAEITAATPNSPVGTADSVAFDIEGVDIEVVSKGVSNNTPTFGNSITYTIVLRNNGPDTATNVTMEDVIPFGLDCTGSSDPGEYSCVTGVWNAGTLASSEQKTLQIFAEVVNQSQVTITNTARALDADQIDTNSANDSKSVEVTLRSANLRVSLDSNKVVRPFPPPFPPHLWTFRDATYAGTISNSGPSTATGIKVTITFNKNVDYQEFNGLSNCVNVATGTTRCDMSNIGDDASRTFDFRIRFDTCWFCPPVPNLQSISVSGAEGDPDPGNNSTDTSSLPALIVNSTDDNASNGICNSSHCNLREAINAAAASPLHRRGISFDLPTSAPLVISLNSPLPSIAGGVTIDGTTQPGFSQQTMKPVVEIDGANAGGDANGLHLIGGNVTIKGLVIRGFTGDGILIEGPGGDNVIQGNFIGTNREGAEAGDSGNGGNGIQILNSARNIIGGSAPGEGNLVSGSGAEGILINGETSRFNEVEGNHIGTDITGMVGLGNGSHGVALTSFASDNIIGGSDADAGNVISGNEGSGVFISGTSTSKNVVLGNLIGTGENAQSPLPNAGGGVVLQNASSNIIGGSLSGDGNVISGNTGAGISISGIGSTGNKVQGNLIGANALGLASLPNTGGGVLIKEGARGNEVGGSPTPGVCDGACNLISGNTGAGLKIEGVATTNNTVRGNFIGTNVGGAATVRNTSHGVSIVDAVGNTVGGANSPDNDLNLISGNGGAGVHISGESASANTVIGNIIGANMSGTAAIANASHGITIVGASGNTVGDTVNAAAAAPCDGQCNLISGNTGNGVNITGETASGNVLRGNFIGSSKDGKSKVGNGSHGVNVSGAPNNDIGGNVPSSPGNRPCSGTCNVISGNNGSGVNISGEAATGNTVRSNFIGTDSTGIIEVGNALHGVSFVGGALNNRVGGTVSEKNDIAFNGGDGVSVQTGTGNAVLSNSIFNNGGEGIDLGGNGLTFNDPKDADDGANKLQNFPFFATVRLDDNGKLIITYNVDSDPAESGAAFPLKVQFFKADSQVNGEGRIFLMEQNYPSGLDSLTAELLGAPLKGVKTGTPIVATVTDANNNTSEFAPVVPVNQPRTFIVNSIADNPATAGICDAADCTLREAINASNINEGIRDFIHFNLPSGEEGLGAIQPAIAFPEISDPVIIDGTTQPGFAGLPLVEINGTNAGVQGIGLKIVGGNSIVRGLVINRFRGDGIRLEGEGGNVLEGNYIGTNVTGDSSDPDGAPNSGDEMGNGGDGLRIARSPDNVIGGTTQESRNIISGNTGNGIAIFGAEATGNLIQGNLIGVDVTGAGDLGNGARGILLSDPSGNSIVQNTIAHNEGNGVAILSTSAPSVRNLISENSIFSNDGLGIDLNDNGRTSNDPTDPDSGVNNLQNFPSIKTAEIDANGDLVVSYSVDSSFAASAYPLTLEFFQTDAANQEGMRLLLGSVVYNPATNPLNSEQIQQVVVGSGLVLNIVDGDFIVTTATDSNGNTSEFSNARQVGATPAIVTVTTSADSVTCDGSGCSLRGAISQIQNGGDSRLHRIEFNLDPDSDPNFNADTGVFTVKLGSELPTITTSMIIDGETQPGFSGTPSIELNGEAAGASANGLLITSGKVRSQGLAINRFRGNGVVLSGGSGSIIRGNFIGTNATGNSAQKNFGAGIRLENSNSNTIGGVNAGAGNVISGNGVHGILIKGSASISNIVQGNLVGTDSSGKNIIRNTFSGIRIEDASNNLIGGEERNVANIVAGNGEHGVQIFGSLSSNNRVQGNFIGTDSTATLALGNVKVGVQVENASNNHIGVIIAPDGSVTGKGNIIAFNGGEGIVVKSGTQNTILSNSVFSNTRRGIQLDAPTNANNLQAKPTIEAARLNAYGNLIVKFRVPSDATRIEFFKAGPDGKQGMTFLGTATYTRNPGDLQQSTLPDPASFGVVLEDGDIIVATATHNGNTSEFSGGIPLTVARTFVITSTSDDAAINALTNICESGTIICTLRSAIQKASAIEGADRIEFDIQTQDSGFDPVNGVFTFQPLSALPIIGDPIIIDGASQPGFDGKPTIEVNGTNVGGGADGLIVTSGDTLLRGLIVNRFAGNGISLQGNGSNPPEGNFDGGSLIDGNFIGTNATGVSAQGNAQAGIVILDSDNNIIGGTSEESRNVISGNTNDGIVISGKSSNNVVLGNFIGANVSGNNAVANGRSGILISAASNNTIGGAEEGAGNLVSGNQIGGIQVLGTAAENNAILGNFIGTNDGGTSPVPNKLFGVNINGAPNNTVGGTDAEAANVISGNAGDGINISGADAENNKVLGNFIGTNHDGTGAIPNENGVVINDAPTNSIGDIEDGARNIISGNNFNGVSISGSGAKENSVLGNFIGTDVLGANALPNSSGIVITNAPDNIIGGAEVGARNIISGNLVSGVSISGLDATGNAIKGNFIGTNVSGTSPLPNASGVITTAAPGNFVGGINEGEGNLISGNVAEGVNISGPDSSNNMVQGNIIGANASVTSRLSNRSGVLIFGAPDNVIGGTDAGAANVISGNAIVGVGVSGITAAGNRIEGNFIGTNGDGTIPIANGSHGVSFDNDASDNFVGGAPPAPLGDPDPSNVIANNGGDGVFVDSGKGNAILSNSTFANANKGIALNAANNANNSQKPPEIESAVINAYDNLILKYKVDATTAESLYPLRVQFFKADDGEGRTFLFEETYVAADAQQTVKRNFGNATEIGIAFGEEILATATDANNNTSEFSVSFVVGETKTFIVNSTDDRIDANIGDGLCDDGSGNCTLRAAIEEANHANNEGADLIAFGIGTGAQTIAPITPLPEITDAVVIDGTTQPLFLDRPLITLNGAGSIDHGLRSTAGDTLIRGISIINFVGNGIELIDNGDAFSDGNNDTGSVIEGSFIGLDSSGAGMGNGGVGVLIQDSINNVIGGATSGKRNVISSNSADGVRIETTTGGPKASRNNVVFGNFIGTTPDGAASIGNGQNGVAILDSPDNIIGGDTLEAANVIGGNGTDASTARRNGVLISGANSVGNIVKGNFIGADPSATLDLGNAFHGVAIEDNAQDNTIGKTASFVLGTGFEMFGAGNTIAFNGRDGVFVESGLNNSILSNSLFENDQLGIDLFENSNTAYVVNQTDGTISVIDGASNIVIDVVNVGNAPVSVAVNPITNAIYTANQTDGTISVIDGASNIVIDVVNVGNDPVSVAVNQLNNSIYVVNQTDGTVSVIDSVSNTIKTTVTVGNNPVSVAVNPVSNTAYVVNQADGTVSVINGATNAVTDTITVGVDPVAVAVNPNTNTVYVVNQTDSTVSVIDSIFNTITDTITVGADPVAIAVNTNTNFIYVVNQTDSNVSVINGATNSVTDTVDVGDSPTAITVNPVTNTIYVANQADGNVSVIDGTINSVTDTVAVGNSPVSVAVDSLDVTPGPNRLMASPDVISVRLDPPNDELIINYSVDFAAASATPLLIEFFIADQDASEGKRLLVSDVYTQSSPSPPKSAKFVLSLLDVQPTQRMVSTATDVDGNTSEFSTSVRVEQVTIYAVNSSLDTADAVLDGKCNDGSGNCTLRAAIQESNGFGGKDTIVFDAAVSQISLNSSLPDISDALIIDGAGSVTIKPAATANIDNGLKVTADSVEIRGLTIDGFDQHGIWLASSQNTVQGSMIQNNTLHGVFIDGSNENVIGGSVLGEENRIRDNGGSGILISSGVGNTLEGNVVTSNDSHGVQITGVSIENRIGGTAPASPGDPDPGNTISSNDGDGIFVEDGTLNSILANSISNNTGLGIRLEAANNANNGQVAPALQTARLDSTANEFVVNYEVVTGGVTDVHVEFFVADADGREGMKFLASDTYTPGTGIKSRTFNTNDLNDTVDIDDEIVATATLFNLGGDGDTSEFSPSVLVIGPIPLLMNSTADTPDINHGDGVCSDVSGRCTLRAAIEEANAFNGTDIIAFTLSVTDPNFANGVFTIPVNAPLPVISDRLIIDGTTQPQFVDTPVIILDGTNAGAGAHGLHIMANNSAVRGVVVNRFDGNGILLEGGDNNSIEGNFIGTDTTGAATAGFGNSLAGIHVLDSSDNEIEDNTIAGNDLDGVSVEGDTSLGNRLSANSIFNNGEIGIDLITSSDAVPGVTANDAGDADGSPNHLQNFPVLENVRITSDSELVIDYKVDSLPSNSAYGIDGLKVEFFTADSQNSGEGKGFIGEDLYPESNATDTKSVNLGDSAALGVGLPDFIVATATDADGNTSEFSVPVRVQPEVRITVASNATVAGNEITYTITVTNNGKSDATNVKLTDTLPSSSSLQSATATQGGCIPGGGVVTCDLVDLKKDPLDPDKPVSATVTIIVANLSNGTHQNSGEVSADQPIEGGNPTFTNTSVIGGGGGPIGGGGGTFTPPPSPPVITVGQNKYDVSAIKGQTNPEPLILEIWNSGPNSVLQWSLSDDATWLTATPPSGRSDAPDSEGDPDKDEVKILIDTISLEPGTHIAIITINGTTATNDPLTVEVELEVEPPLPRIGVNSDNLTFTAVRNGTLAPPRTLEVRNIGGRILEWSAEADSDWVILSSNTGETEAAQISPISVLVDSVGLSDGTHKANITIVSEGATNSPRVVEVTLLVLPPEPVIAFSPGSIDIRAARGSPTIPQILQVWNGGGRSLTWSVSDDADWLRLSPTGGSSTGEKDSISVIVDITNLSFGAHRANIEIFSSQGVNSPQQVQVTLIVGAPIDSDSDGVADFIEDAGPNAGDSNIDQIPDKRQRNIAPLPDPVEGIYGIFSAADVVRLNNVASVENPSPGDAPDGLTFPLGFFTTDSVELTRGQAIEITFRAEFGKGVKFNSFHRFGPTPSNPQPHWYEFTFDGTTGAEIFDDRIVLHLVDGRRGDDDLTANGRIGTLGAPTLDLRADMELSSSPISNTLTVVQELRYTLVVTNNGPSEAINVEISQRFPQGTSVTVVGLLPSQGECRDDGVINCNLGNLNSDASASLAVTLTTPVVGELIINPRTSSSNLDSDADNNELTVNINVTSPTINLDTTGFGFTSVRGNPNPRARQIQITNIGDGQLNWFASSVCDLTGQTTNLAPWLRISPSQGTVTDAPQTINLLANISGLAEGIHRTSFFITALGATNDCQLVSVDLTVLSPIGRPQQASVNLQSWEAKGLAEVIGAFLDTQKANVADQAQQRWFDIGESIAEAFEADSTSLRPLVNPASDIEMASSTLAAVGGVFGNWGPGSEVPPTLGEDTLEFVRTMSAILSGGQSWQNLGVTRIDSAGTDSLYVAYDRAEGKVLVHLDVFNPAAPGQIDAIIPVTVGENGNSLVSGGDEESAIFVRRVPMVTINLQSPGELRVFDQLGRVSGIIKGSTIEMIPSSVFAGDTVSILMASEVEALRLKYEITGTEVGIYGMQATMVNTAGRSTVFPRQGVAITRNEVHQYSIDWPRLSLRRNTGWVVRVDTDGNGTFESEFPPPIQEGRAVWPIVLVASLGGIVVIGLVIWALYVLFQPARRILTKIWRPFKRFAAKIGIRIPRIPSLPKIKMPWG